jgi:hypothetical protein
VTCCALQFLAMSFGEARRDPTQNFGVLGVLGLLQHGSCRASGRCHSTSWAMLAWSLVIAMI